MKILICGSGSIALRHYKNLISIGYNDIIFYKFTKYFRENSKLKNNKIYYNLKKALNQKPQVLILDEATSAQNNQTEETVMESVKKLGKDITIIIIAHRLNTVKNCDIIFKFIKG